MENKGKYYITTAIPYASGKPHIGNVYDPIVADAIARYKRGLGYDVFFLTGTDEHGQKVEDLAKKANVTPKEYVDNTASTIKDIWDLLGTSYDHFIRTSDEHHVKAVQHIATKLFNQGDIYKGSYEGLYCVPCESFYTETQAPDGICPDCGRPLKKQTEESYFFKMSKYADKLLEYYENTPNFFVPDSRRKEMINNFIKPGLQDLCISRTTITWGIPLEFDPKHVVYVWLDALTNYITGLGYDVDEQGDLYKKYWPCDLHVIGKDIVRFHSIYWPIFLMALGEPLPKQLLGHPWILFGQDKMSKSKGNVIYPDEAAKYFGVDGLRYYLLSQTPFANDGSITYESLIKVFNVDLANTFGNLVSRTISMTKKYFGAEIPKSTENDELDLDISVCAKKAYDGFVENFESYHFADAISSVFELLSRANKYIDETMPWALAKDETKVEKLKTVIYNLLEVIRISALLLKPVMPTACEKILACLECENNEFEDAKEFGKLEAGILVKDIEILFARIDEAKLLAQIEADKEAAKNT